MELAEIRALAEHLEATIAEASEALQKLRKQCFHLKMQPLPDQKMGMSIASVIYYCPDCLHQEDRDW